jgi:hypothetical protein
MAICMRHDCSVGKSSVDLCRAAQHELELIHSPSKGSRLSFLSVKRTGGSSEIPTTQP